MYKISLVFFLAFSTINCVAQTDSITKANQILEIEQALMNALPGDTSLWSKYLDARWYIITEDGTGYFKKEFLAGFSPFPKGFSGNIKVINPVFTFYDKMAIIHFVADEHENVYGQELHTTYATANTYYQANDSWKMIGSQIFEIPQLPLPVKVSLETLKEYTGTYQLTDSNMAVISLQNGSLVIQKSNGKPDTLLPETANVFFRKKDTRGRKIFAKTETGQMLMLERRNGNDLIWKRIK